MNEQMCGLYWLMNEKKRGLLTGMPANCGFSRRLWSSFLDASNFSRSAASTMYLDKQQTILD